MTWEDTGFVKCWTDNIKGDMRSVDLCPGDGSDSEQANTDKW